MQAKVSSLIRSLNNIKAGLSAYRKWISISEFNQSLINILTICIKFLTRSSWLTFKYHSWNQLIAYFGLQSWETIENSWSLWQFHSLQAWQLVRHFLHRWKQEMYNRILNVVTNFSPQATTPQRMISELLEQTLHDDASDQFSGSNTIIRWSSFNITGSACMVADLQLTRVTLADYLYCFRLSEGKKNQTRCGILMVLVALQLTLSVDPCGHGIEPCVVSWPDLLCSADTNSKSKSSSPWRVPLGTSC